VLDAVVVGRPDPELGEVPVAYVSLREHDDARELLRGYFDGRLAPWKHPRDVIVIDSVPRSANGKLMRRELIAREREAHGLTMSGSARS
jgi:acyl-coenzyme A synthetase/AMP-(fatty) acid ligase